ncbi:SIS domain-containing protein [Nonomuraea dietziae]|uniref:SIS domain-containing protein n=1 Tax=Nonomuraea dietziae TaxID=65515 RepID=UPI0031DA1A44
MRSAIAAELIVSGDVTLGERSVVIFTSVSGTTDDSIRAIEYCKARGAYTVGFTGYADSPIAKSVDVALISEPKTWPFDMQMLLFMGRLLARRGEFDGYDKLADELAGIPGVLVEVAKQGPSPWPPPSPRPTRTPTTTSSSAAETSGASPTSTRCASSRRCSGCAPPGCTARSSSTARSS